MRRWMRLSAAVVFLMAGGFVMAGEEESEEHDTTVTQSELPAKVAETVKEYGRGGEFVSAVKGDEDGVPVYEVKLKKGDNKIEVQTTVDGELNMREEVVENSDLPPAALKRVLKEHPGAEVKRVEKTIRTIYEVQIVDSNGKKTEALVTPGGQMTTEPEELNKDEKGKKGEDEENEKEESSKPGKNGKKAETKD